MGIGKRREGGYKRAGNKWGGLVAGLTHAARYRHIDIGISLERTHFLATSICSIRKLRSLLNVTIITWKVLHNYLAALEEESIKPLPSQRALASKTKQMLPISAPEICPLTVKFYVISSKSYKEISVGVIRCKCALRIEQEVVGYVR